MKVLSVALLLFCFTSCQENKEAILKEKTAQYFAAWNARSFDSPAYKNFKRDTSYTWHGSKEGTGNLSVYKPNSGWKQWDIAWNGTYLFDSLQFDPNQNSVTGRFNETTDFLKIIGMSEGYSATVTYWFDENNQVAETLYGWDENNPSMSDYVKPIVEWAKVNDSTTIKRIYLDGGFEPNTENAMDWKRLFEQYEIAHSNQIKL